MTSKHWMMIAGALVAFATDWVNYRKAQGEHPDAKFQWDLLVAKVVIGIGTAFGIGEVTA